MLEQENNFYMTHQTEFKEKYLDKWLVIVGESLWGVYDKVSDAGKAALQNFEPGEFLIHRPADDDTIIEIGPIVSVKRDGNNQEDEINSVMTVLKGEPVAIQYAY